MGEKLRRKRRRGSGRIERIGKRNRVERMGEKLGGKVGEDQEE